ncbi:MAG: helix-turn-helix domain-containing protein [Chloroflexi bacterium]|nr:helix-turn-helix domain-containing protein [Chloroflexota bacterium]
MTTPDTPPLAVRPAQAAGLLNVSRRTICTLLARGELRSVRIGRARLIPRAELERLLNNPPGAASVEEAA